MRNNQSLRMALNLAVTLLILKVTASIVANYVDYWPPDFTAEFLRGRKATFFSRYQWAFYPHILSGPLTIILGMVLMSARFRQQFPSWHRRLGRVQVCTVLFVLAPSGFWMAWFAQAGLGVQLGFAALSLATGISVWNGWLYAMKRDFAQHQIWMTRCYLLLCSAIVTRIIGGFFIVTEIDGDWTYYMAAWPSWLVPLVIYEVNRIIRS